jgi:hypothetical protein
MTRVPNKSSLTTSNYNRSSLLGSMADDFNVTYDIGDLGQLDLFPEKDMREKYPALKQAYEHYQSILEVCKTKEREDAN